LLSTPSPAGEGGQRPDGENQKMDSSQLKERSRQLRRNMTIAEKKLWSYLRNKRFNHLRFRRQMVLGNYIVDFVSFDAKIIIEIDGSQHLDQVDYDQTRTKYLSLLGYKVLRYWNNEVLRDIDTVLADIWNNCFIDSDSPHPACGHLPQQGKAC
jgi:very-short-patch-repair endonuclease